MISTSSLSVPLKDRARAARLLVFGLLALAPRPASAFWLLNFGTAAPLPQGGVAFIGGTGGQLTEVGTPVQSSYTPFLAHAGIRVGLASFLDAGFRLCTVPLPFNVGGGPVLGGEIDLKLRLTPARFKWQASVLAGVGYAYLLLQDQSKSAWSPGAEVTVSRDLSGRVTLTLNARYAYTGIPTGLGGMDSNLVHSFGGSVGLRIGLTQNIAILPEVGGFGFEGAITGKSTNGWGLQYGVVLAARVR